MLRAVIKKGYLSLVTLIQGLAKQQKVQDQHIVVMMTFKEDLLPVIEALIARGYKVTVITKDIHFQTLKDNKKLKCELMSHRNLYRQIQVLRSAKVIFIDTYYHLFGAYKKQPNQTIIQTWHAAGALKNFGLEDHSVNLNHHKEVAQHQAVYHAVDKYLIGSTQMGDCFKRSFGIQDQQLLKCGLPRLSHYLNRDVQEEQQRLKCQLGIEGKVAVYLPTYREEGQINHIIDQQAFKNALPEFTLLSNYHPAVEAPENSHRISLSTPELLILADVIITDYSSLAIEASVIEKPSIFYVYDEKIYERMRGLNSYYYQIPDNYKVYNEDELYERIKSAHLKSLFDDWHTFNTRDSVEKLMDYVDEVVYQ